MDDLQMDDLQIASLQMDALQIASLQIDDQNNFFLFSPFLLRIIGGPEVKKLRQYNYPAADTNSKKP